MMWVVLAYNVSTEGSFRSKTFWVLFSGFGSSAILDLLSSLFLPGFFGYFPAFGDRQQTLQPAL